MPINTQPAHGDGQSRRPAAGGGHSAGGRRRTRRSSRSRRDASARHERIVIKVGGGGRSFADRDPRASPSASTRSWCCRRARSACCPTPIRSTCMSAARRARSAATTPWSEATPAGRHRHARRLPVRLLGHRLSEGRRRHQPQRRYRRSHPLRQHADAGRRHRRQSRSPARGAGRPGRQAAQAGRLACRMRGAQGRMGGLPQGAARRHAADRRGLAAAGDDPAAGGPHGARLRRRDRRGEALRCRRRAGESASRSPTDDRPFETFTETGASYMGYAASALMAAALADTPDLPDRLFRRRIVHDEPADPARRGRASACAPRSSSSTTGAWRRSPACSRRNTAPSSAPAIAWRSTISAWPVPFRACWRSMAATRRTNLRVALADAHAHHGLAVIHVPVYGGTRSGRRPGRLWLVERRQLGGRRRRALRPDRHLTDVEWNRKMDGARSILIDNTWCASVSGATMPVHSPATEEEIGTIPSADADDVTLVLASAERGYATWRAMAAWDRAKIMRKAADLIRERNEDDRPRDERRDRQAARRGAGRDQRRRRPVRVVRRGGQAGLWPDHPGRAPPTSG